MKQKRVYFAFVVVFCAFVAHFLCIFVHFCAFLLELRSLWNPRQTWRASGGSRRRENKQDGAFKLGRNTSGFVYVYFCLCIFLPLLEMLVAIVSSTEALFVFGAVVAIYLRVTIHLACARLLGMGILIIRMLY